MTCKSVKCLLVVIGALGEEMVCVELRIKGVGSLLIGFKRIYVSCRIERKTRITKG
jgi:hypothetical protein